MKGDYDEKEKSFAFVNAFAFGNDAASCVCVRQNAV